MKVLIIDDEKILSRAIAKNLEKNWYYADTAHSLHEYQELDPSAYDGFIVDISLRDGSGIDIVRELRDIHNTHAPIIIISGNTHTDLKVEWLDSWADDYITKPFSPDELMARIRSIIRRSSTEKEAKNIQKFKDLSFNLKNREVKLWEKKINFGKKEKQIIEYFLFHKNELVPKRKLVKSLWKTKDQGVVTDNTINVTVYKVRKKLWDSFPLETKIGQWYILRW